MSVASLPGTSPGGNISHLIRLGSPCASVIQFAKREVVYGCLERDRNVYVVERGLVKAVAPSRDGKECLLGIYTDGDVFGDLSLFGGVRLETVTAMTPTVLSRISSVQLLDALSDPRLREEFIGYLARRLAEQQQLITDLVTTDSEYRLAAILLQLARKLGIRQGPLLRIEARITQEELSAMVGTTRSRIGFFLKRFHQAGLVARTASCALIVHEPRLDEFMSIC
jgi:CRP-like cAMP-binding protein